MTVFKEHLNKKFIENIVPPQKGRDYYYDLAERGLLLDVTSSGSKVFYLYKKSNGRPVRVRLGDSRDINIYEARKLANEKRALLNSGTNPNIEKKKFRQEATLGELCKEYMERYAKRNKRTWAQDEQLIHLFLTKWQYVKISEITKIQVQKLHEQISDEHGKYQANRLLSCLKTIYNRAIEWGWHGTNPAVGIKKNREIKRDRFLQKSELRQFFDALQKEPNINARNLILLALFTGQRKSNVMAIRWDEIDFDTGIWRIPQTKNGDPLNVALVDEAKEILYKTPHISEWVFPAKSKTGHIVEIGKVWRNLLKRADIQDLRFHDLRRTFASYQAILGSSLPIIGSSLGHKSSVSTQIYARLSTDPVHDSAQRAVSYIKELADK